MNFFKFLFGNRKSVVNEKFRPVEKDFSVNERFVKDAFNRVIAGVEMQCDIKEPLYESYFKAYKSGNPRNEIKVFIEHLNNTQWRWIEFDRWLKIFNKEGAFPVVWQHRPEIYMEPPESPKSVNDALTYLTVSDMRQVLKSNNIKHKPAPCKRSEFEKLIKNTLEIEHLKRHLDRRVNIQRAKHSKKRFEGLCSLLVRTITSTAYSLMRDYQMEKSSAFIKKRYPRHAKGGDGCPIEDRFAERFIKGDITELPPYFPGDRTRVWSK